MKSFIFKYKYEIISFLITFASVISIFFVSGLRFSNDDQFILYRYIENISEGKGFVYNEGEKILGSTTPLFTLLAALLTYISGFEAYTSVVLINIISISVSSIFFFKILERYTNGKFALFSVIVFAFNMSKIVSEGMESSLFILAVLGFLYFLISKKNYTAAVFLALSILTRPDAGIIAMLALIYWIKNEGFLRAIKFSIVTALAVLPWILFSTYYFGSFIPQSLIAKLHTEDIVNQSDIQALKVQLSHLSRIYWGKFLDYERIFLQVLFNLIPFLALFILGLWQKLNKENWIIFLIPVLYFISFSYSNPVMFPWYTTQIEPFWMLGSLLGLFFILEKINRPYFRVVILLFVIIGPTWFFADLLTTEKQGSKMSLFDIGYFLKENVREGERVGVNNIGIIGYTSKAYIIDFFGLVNQDSYAFYPVIECADRNIQYIIPPNLIRHFEPEWLVLSGETELTPCFRDSKWFKDNYSLIYSKAGFVYRKIDA
jgi:hypothetical protein